MTKSRVVVISTFFLIAGCLHTGLYAQPRVLLFQTFDSAPAPGLPPGWTTTTAHRVTGDWFDTTLAGVSPPQVCYCRDAAKEQILTCPPVDFSGYDADSIIFYARRSASFDAVMGVEYSTDDGASWAVIDTLSASIPTGSFRRYSFKIPSVAGGRPSVTFRYRNHGDGSGSSGATRLDDFTVRGIPSGLTDGSGWAVIHPDSIDAGLAAVAETLNLGGTSPRAIEGVRITVPGSWQWPQPGPLGLGGSGFDSARFSVTGSGSGDDPYLITVVRAAVTVSDAGTVVIGGLAAPFRAGPCEFRVETRGEGGSFTPIASSPSWRSGRGGARRSQAASGAAHRYGPAGRLRAAATRP